MRKPICGDNIFDMITPNQDAASESRIERMRKFLSSPLTRKKPSGTQSKTFGTSLDVLIQRSPTESSIPFIVTRICQYIERSGLIHEGLFRISGNARLIERLKTCFDQSGDAPLETEGDVPSAAALLKLFLRELPDPIIPMSMHQQFLNAVKGNDKEASIGQLVQLVERLPSTNFSILKYLSYFLLQVSQYEEQNRMSAASLGIVFGPNLFRVTEDFVGLKEQSLTNQIVTYFITDYYAIFHEEPKYYGKEKVSTALDVHTTKHCKSSFGHKVSMVSSWPKPTAFSPTMISTLSLQPLSVSIPAMDDTHFPIGSYAQPINRRDDHVLMVNSLTEEDLHVSSADHSSSDLYVKDNNGATLSTKRKRKDRKLLKEDILASYSNFGELSPHSSEEALNAECLSYPTVEIEAFRQTNHLVKNVTESSTALKFAYIDASNVPKAINLNEITELSPHPPKPKRREIENISYDHHEPLIVAGACSNENELNFHETLQHVDRITAHTSPQRKQIVHPNEFHVDKKLNMMDDLEIVELESMVGDKVDILAFTSCEPEKYFLEDHGVDETGDTDSMKENKEAVITHAEIHDLSSLLRDQSPAPEKKVDNEHKRYHRGRRHRSYHHKKQYAEDGNKRISQPLLELHPDQQEIQLEVKLEKSVFDECTNSSTKESTPPSNLELTHNAVVNNTDQRYSWPILRSLQEDENIALSPLPQLLRISNSSEAPLSPSAYRSYLSHRSLHLDPNLPPSPPVEQEDIAIGTKDDVNKATLKQMSKKIHGIKKKIKQFEESFEVAHGYRPSYAEKSHNADVKKLILELNHSRQELKQLKEEPHVLDAVTPQQWTPAEEEIPSTAEKISKGTNTGHYGTCYGPTLVDGEAVTVEESLNEALDYLSEKRNSSERPEAFEEMTKDQVVEEKLTIQKLLLKFESIHGRPSTKAHRDIMRPLYDRYRSAKRIISRSTSFSSTSKIKEAMELQPILEHVAMDFRSSEGRKNVESPPIDNEVNTEKDENKVESEIINDTEATEIITESQESYNEYKLPEAQLQQLVSHSILHELSLPELFEQQQQARAEKRRLRKVLREFENQFQKDNGRKVQREDKVAMESVYGEYKNVRARLKLLEALATKCEQKNK